MVRVFRYQSGTQLTYRNYFYEHPDTFFMGVQGMWRIDPSDGVSLDVCKRNRDTEELI